MPTSEVTRYTFPGNLKGLTRCFSVVERQKTPLEKPDSKSVASWHTHFLTENKSQSSPMHKCNAGFVQPLYCSHNLMVCSLGYRKANKYTNIHYYVHRFVHHSYLNPSAWEYQSAVLDCIYRQSGAAAGFSYHPVITPVVEPPRLVSNC